LNVFAAPKEHLGSLDGLTRIVRLGVFTQPPGTSSTSPGSRTPSRICFGMPLASRNIGSAGNRRCQPSPRRADWTRSHLRSRRV